MSGDGVPPPAVGGGESSPQAGTSAAADAADAAAAAAAAAVAAAATANPDEEEVDQTANDAGGTGVPEDGSGSTSGSANVLRTRHTAYAKKLPPGGGKAANKTGLPRATKQELAREQENHIKAVSAKAVSLMEAAALVVSNPATDFSAVEDMMSELQDVYGELQNLPRDAMTLRNKNAADNTIRLRLAELNIAVRMAQKKKERAEASTDHADGGTMADRLRRLSEAEATEGGGFGSTRRVAAVAPGGAAADGGGAAAGDRDLRMRTHSVPSWVSEDNPYVPSICRLPASYWHGFPYPWNVQPQRAADLKPGDILKITAAALPKFGGYKEEYVPWRSAFIPCVHVSPIDISLKIMLFMGTMEGRTFRMKEFKKNFVCTPGGYRTGITYLENTFGGEDNLLMTLQQALMNLPLLREGDFVTLELLHIRLSTFLIEWGVSMGGGVEAESLAFFHVLMAKIDPPFSRKYMDWLRRHGERKGLQSLHDWAGEQLEDHRSVETYARCGWGRETSARRLPPPPRAGARPPPPWRPGGHLDRIPRPQPQQVLVGATAWEEVEEDFGEETREEHLLLGRERDQAQRRGCPLCQDAHGLGRCEQFRKMTPQERRDYLAQQRRCYTCFQPGHNVQNCKLRLTCTKCGRGHHILLHGAQWDRLGGGRAAPSAAAGAGGASSQRERALLADAGEEEEAAAAPPSSPDDDDEEDAAEAVFYGFKSAQGRSRVSLRTVGLWVGHASSGKEEYVTALLDDGCTSSALVGEELASKLKLTGRLANVVTEGVGGATIEGTSLFTQIRIRSYDGQVVRVIPAQVMAKPAGTYEPVDWEKEKEKFPHLSHACFPPLSRSWKGIHLLLGNGNPYLLSSRKELAVEEHLPRARLTPLGWTAIGRAKIRGSENCLPAPPSPGLLAAAEADGEVWMGDAPEDSTTLFTRASPSDKQLHRLVNRLWEVEEFREREELAPEEKYLLRLMEEKGTRENGQFVLPCTWKPGGERPPLNKAGALSRLESLERSKYFRDANIRKSYAEGVQELEKENFITQVDAGEAKHYLAHFPILKPGSLTTSLRIVMDCSVALNKYLLSGPKLMNDVVSVLLRFRSRLVGFTGDVSKMFFRIKMLPEDKPYHCFLWREEAASAPRTYSFNVHVFGNTGSPFVAIYAVKEQARLHAEQFPKAAETISRSSLVDDILDSEDTVEEAAEVLRDVRTLFAHMGMEVRKCLASHPGVLQGLPAEACLSELLEVAKACAKVDGLESLKTLGIRYDCRSDLFSFHMGDHSSDYWTKRKILKVFPQLFDPLGLVLPFALQARCIFSKVAREVPSWDEKLDPSRLERWIRWVKHLKELPLVKIPRCVKQLQHLQRAELHLFSDASSQAYAAAAYLRTCAPSGDATVRLIMSRGKVAPASTSSIPRLELLGAELAANLAQTVKAYLKVEVEQVYYWTDSLNVLFWLRNEKHRLQTFVQNRVSRIGRTTAVGDWKWVPTDQNPADLPTRGKAPGELAHSQLWWTGPPFLKEKETHWPKAARLEPSSAALQELKKVDQVFLAQTAATSSVIPFVRYGSWQKLVGVVRRLLSWRSRVLLKREPKHQEVERALLLQVQAESAASWSKGESAGGKKGDFRHLPLFKDENGLLRGRTRLSAAQKLPRSVREPLFLPRQHPAVRLLVRHLHEKSLHHAGGVNHTLAKLRERYWLTQGRRTVFQALKDCVPCRRRAAKPSRPRQGQLPAFRIPVQEDKPLVFSQVGVDCAGPYRIKRGRSIELHYFLLLTCCKTRAIRLEWLADMSTDSFLQAWSRLSCRGVSPRMVVSDNGSNFVGANKLQGVLWELLRSDRLKVEAQDARVEWKFNPPYASHYGGVFERLIGAAKRALYHVLPDTLTLTLEQFITALAIAESVVNSRPLAYVGGEGEEVPLTPAHFLAGSGPSHLYQIRGGEGASLAKRWLQVQALGDLFWKRLQKEIVPHLQAATQQERGCYRNIQVNDVVVFLHPVQRARWPLARVQEVFPGPDGKVRTLLLAVPAAHLQKEKKTFKRDVSSVALLLPAEETY